MLIRVLFAGIRKFSHFFSELPGQIFKCQHRIQGIAKAGYKIILIKRRRNKQRLDAQAQIH